MLLELVEEHTSDEDLRWILRHRRYAIRDASRWAFLVIGVLIALGVGTALQAKQEGQRVQLVGGGSALVAFYRPLYDLVVGWLSRATASVLVLRRFRQVRRNDFVWAKVVGECSRGLAVPFTLESTDYRGEASAATKAFRQYGIMPFFLLALGLTITTGGQWQVAIFFCVVLFGGIHYWFRSRTVVKLNKDDVQSQVDAFVARVRSQVVVGSPCHTLRASDDAWKNAVSASVTACDIVFLDLFEWSESLAWEIDVVFRTKKARRIILAFPEDADLVESTNEAPQGLDAVPNELRCKLVDLVPIKRLRRAQYLGYTPRPARDLLGRLSSSLEVEALTVAIARAQATLR